jgi:RHS repeat-associated protein
LQELSAASFVPSAAEVYVENLAGVPVWFDRRTASHLEIAADAQSTGALPVAIVVQETHYDPWGLELAGIGYVADPTKESKFTYNGKEKQDQFGLGWLDYGARHYQPDIARWGGVDPLAFKYAPVSPYNYALNNPIRFVDPNGEDILDVTPVRLIFHGGAKKAGDNSAFEFAAKNVAKDYGGVKSVSMNVVSSAQEIVNTINKQADGSVQSVDIFTHGGTNALYTYDPEGAVAGNTSLYRGGAKQFFNLAWGEGSATIGEIDFNKFTNSAKIELHGCNTCDANSKNDNIAADFSTRLYDAGKTKAVVIGHSTSANPNIKGKKTTNSQQDYRHGKRVVYHNGKVLFSTSIKGRIRASIIDQYLAKKEKKGDEYDGSKEIYKKTK